MNNLPKNRRVLIVDDNRAIHDDFRKILAPASTAALDATEAELFGTASNAVRKIQYEIDSAYQGEEAVQLVKQALAESRPYAMAFVDVRMPPGMDGVETTRKIWEADPDVQIVLCTAYSDYSWDEMFEKIGSSDGLLILKKPFDSVEALQMAQAMTEKWWLRRQSQRKLEELERMVAARTGELQWKTAFLEAEVDSSVDGILVVDGLGKKILQNQQFVDLFKIPQQIADEKDDTGQLEWVTSVVKNPKQFAEKVVHLYFHREEISRDEIELKDGTTMDRYSSPVADSAGNYYGRLWTFRDITERKRAEAALHESELRYRSLFENMLEGYAHCQFLYEQGEPCDFIYLEVNDAFEKLTGLKNIVGKKISEIIPGHRESDRELFEMYSRVASTGKPEQCDSYVEVLGFWFSISVYSHEKGHFVAVFENITERKKAEALLLESKQRLSLATESAHIGIWDWDVLTNKLVWDAQMYELYGIREQDFSGAYDAWQNGLHPDDRKKAETNIRAAVDSASGFHDEFRVLWPNGEVRHIEAHALVKRARDGSTAHMIGVNWDITERKRAENLVRQSEERYRSVINNANDAIFTIAADGTFTSLNPAVAAIAELSRDEWIGKPFAPMVHPDDLPLAVEMFRRVLKGEPVPVHELRGNPGLKRPATMEMTLAPLGNEGGKINGVLGIGRDITERKKLEAQLFQSQKLETVGKLAGGIAHEFNSILTAIIGQSDLLIEDLPGGSPTAGSAMEISKAANRAATLTRQLLAYGRKQLLQPEILDLNRVIAGMEEMLRHLMDGEVDMQIVPAADLRAVKADAGQIEQVIMNIVINARDAMPRGGKLTLETANVSFDEESVGSYPELKPGDYVMLAISDTGTGMSAETRAHMFEPFFSTKGVGQGTGLGLSTCYGIVKQSGGHISIYSEPGCGTTFKIYLPQAVAPTANPARRPDTPGLPRGSETILLVEDDPALREMAAALLVRLGYTVLSAGNGIEALTLKQQRGTGHIDLLFTDVIMPHMSGRELAERVRVLYPLTKILFTSAYTESAILHQGVLEKGVALLQKPFTPSALARKVREVLDEPGVRKPEAAL